jgi:hypothetical protein
MSMQREIKNADVGRERDGKRERERDDMENHPAQTASRKSHLPLQKTFSSSDALQYASS